MAASPHFRKTGPNLSKLSVWWLRLGGARKLIKKSNPQQNGRDERMQLPRKKEASRPSSAKTLQQQDRFDVFVQEFNTERPHEAARHDVSSRALCPLTAPL